MDSKLDLGAGPPWPRVPEVEGMSAGEASVFLAAKDWTVRVVEEDGASRIITRDLRAKRANLTVTDGVVVKAEEY